MERQTGELLARFDTTAFPVEVFASKQAVELQYAWRHLSIMERILKIQPKIREQVKVLKQAGLGTEEAFAEILNLKGNPYDAVLKLEDMTDREIAAICRSTL